MPPRHILTSLLFSLILCFTDPLNVFAAPPWALDDQTLQSLRELDEKDIQLHSLLPALSQKAEQDLLGKTSDPKTIDDILGQMESDVRKRAGEKATPLATLAALKAALFDEWQFQPDRSRLFEDSLETALLDPVFQNRKGTCLTLSLVALLVAERLQLPFAGVEVPGHFFLRYQDEEGGHNFESTNGGQEFTDEYYQREYYRRPTPPLIVTLTKKETVAVYLNALGNHYKLQGRLERAIAILKTAIELSPGQPAFVVNLGNAYERSGNFSQAALQYDKALSLDPYLGEAYYNLGLLHFLYTGQLDLAEKYGNIARRLGCRLHPKFRAFLESRDAAGK